VNAVLREITNMSASRDRSVVRSSVIPSAKYCWSGSLLRLAKGNTTIDRRGARRVCEIEVAAGAVAIGVAEAVAWSAGFPAPGGEIAAGQNHHAPQTMTSVAAATMPMKAP
jgi:hypothetical protein